MTPAVGQVWRLAPALLRRLVLVDEQRVEWVTLAAPGSSLNGQHGGTTRAMWSRWVRSARPTLVSPDTSPVVVSDPPATHAPMPSRPDPARLPARALAALRAIVAHAGPEGRVSASRAACERAAGLSTAAYTRALADLEQAGLVARDPQGWRDPLTGAWPARQVTVTTAGLARAAVLTTAAQVSTGEHGSVSTGEHGSVSTGEHLVQDSFLPPLRRKKEEGEEKEEPCSLSTGEHGVSTAPVSTGEHGAPQAAGDCVLVRLPASWGPSVLARALRALADALDPRPAVAPASPAPAPAPVAVAPPTPARTPKAQRLDERDHRGWTGHDAAGPCLADPAHGTCVPRLTRAEPREWIAYCPTCDAVRDPAKLEAARVASMHPEGAPLARQPVPPPEPDVTDRWAEAAARSRAALGEAPTGAGAVARAMADADRDEGMTLRERVAAARAAARPVIQQRRPGVRQLVGAG